jgi:hypothetical protein
MRQKDKTFLKTRSREASCSYIGQKHDIVQTVAKVHQCGCVYAQSICTVCLPGVSTLQTMCPEHKRKMNIKALMQYL